MLSIFTEEDSGISFSASDMLDLDMELAKSTTSKESDTKKKGTNCLKTIYHRV